MEIQITTEVGIPGSGSRKIRQKMKRVLKDLGCDDKELSILFTGDEHISRLNRKYRNKEGPTNVLAFPMAGGPEPRVEMGVLGDVVVSVETACRESADIHEPLEETIDRLLIHGLLHLLGYDHEISFKEAERMEEEEKRIMRLMREA